MATILSALYPPLIDTFMPAFIYNQEAIVNFTISPYNSYAEITKIHISLVDQKTNQNVMKAADNISVNNAEDSSYSSKILNGVWILPWMDSAYLTMDTTNNFYTLKIPAAILKNDNKSFNINQYYKVQIRLDSSSTTIDNISDSSYLIEERAYFSEWSRVCLLKAIPEPYLHLTNFTYNVTDGDIQYATSGVSLANENVIDIIKTPSFQPGIIPFTGNLTFSDGSMATNVTSEYLKSYRIVIENETQEGLICDSGWLYDSDFAVTSNTTQNNITNIWKSSFSYLADLTNAALGSYNATIYLITNNNYETSKTFSFSLENYDVADIIAPAEGFWNFGESNLYTYGEEISRIVTEEDGFVTITFSGYLTNGNDSEQSLGPGYLFIKRATSLDNFSKWEIIHCQNCLETWNDSPMTVTFTDKTIGSLVQYKYAAQYLTLKGSWTQTYLSETIIYPNFHDILLLRGDKQLAIRYNGQITNVTPVVNRIKIDTLGGKYPKFAENAKMNYKQLQLSGLISAESDFNRQFLSDLDYSLEMDYYDANMNGKYQIRNDTLQEQWGDYVEKSTYGANNSEKFATQKNTKHDIYPKDNWWWERKFREEVVKWLNDGEPKLFRSMTEGNLIVMLTDIHLTPNAQLGRRLYNFSATAYEVGDGYSLEDLNALGIFTISNDYQEDLNLGNVSIESSEVTVSKLQQARITSSTEDQQIVLDLSNNNSILSNLNYTYGGLLQNNLVNQTSIVLKDLKIQFTSKPLWYDLDSISWQKTTYEVLVFDETEPTKVIGRATISSDWGEYSTDKIIEQINLWENSLSGNKLYQINSLWGDNEKTITVKRKNILNNGIRKFLESSFYYTPNIGLGYCLRISFSTQENSSSFLTRTIFVNERGYYQIPSNIIVKEITLCNGAEATLDYVLSYKLQYNNVSEPDRYETVKNIRGQISGYWYPNTNLSDLISKKYNSSMYDSGTFTQYILNSWNNINIESTPYSVYKISYIDDSNTSELIIGRTGTLNLKNDYSIDYISPVGKRMFKVDNNRQSYLDEWEFVIDDTLKDNEIWWNASLENTDLLIKLSDEIIDSTQIIDKINKIKQRWEIDSDILTNKEFILDYKIPQYNTVYQNIYSDSGIKTSAIYYLNHGWYSIKNLSDDGSIILACVPIDGIIDYSGTLLKKVWYNAPVGFTG